MFVQLRIAADGDGDVDGSSAAGGQYYTNTRSGIQSGCQITIMVFIHKFISLFKHASEFTDTINNSQCIGQSNGAQFCFCIIFISLWDSPPAIDDWHWPDLALCLAAWVLAMVLGAPSSATVATFGRQRNRSALRCYFNDYADEHRASSIEHLQWLRQRQRRRGRWSIRTLETWKCNLCNLCGWCLRPSLSSVICSISRAIRQIQNAVYQMEMPQRHLPSIQALAQLILIYDFNDSAYKLKAFQVSALVLYDSTCIFIYFCWPAANVVIIV